METFSLWVSSLCVSFFSFFFVSQLFSHSVKFPESIPVVGLRTQWFKSTRASFRQLTDGIRTLAEGYRQVINQNNEGFMTFSETNKRGDQHSRYGRSFLIQESSFQKELILPPEHIKWFSDQTDSTLSSAEIRMERHAVRYLHTGVDFDSTMFFLDRIIGDSLTRKLDMVQGAMYDEICRGIDVVFGADDNDWKVVNVYDSLQEIILRAMGRVFFGLPLGRDPTFLTSFKRYILAMGVATIVIGQLPRILKSLVVPIFNVPLWFYRAKILRALVPVVDRQMSERDDDKLKADGDKYDFITQSARVSAKANSLRYKADPKILAEWILLLVTTLTKLIIFNRETNVCPGFRRVIFHGNSSVEYCFRHCVLPSGDASL